MNTKYYALVAEIERRINAYQKNFDKADNKIARISTDGRIQSLKSILSFINTLEVKEVDFDTEWNRYFEHRGEMATVNIKHLAKHFFALGLRVNNPITAADRGIVEEIILSLKQVENDYRIDHSKEIEWLRNKSQKEEA